MVASILAALAAAGVVAIAALVYRRRGLGTEDHEPSGATAGHAGAMLSALFLLSFAIAIVVPWTAADVARQNTYTEGQAVVEAHWAAARLPAPLGPQVQSELREYVRFVLNRDWPLMVKGELDPEGGARIDRLRTQVAAFKTEDTDEQEAKGAVLEQVRGVAEARRVREADAKARPPAALLAMTVLTGVVVTVFPFMAGARPRGPAVVPLVVMAALLGIGVYMVFDIVSVFDGGLAVGPDAFTSALTELQRISGGR
ncbi:hypothetical protein AB0K60_05245 [Thermopolyspora sp. NPDC052614]|uniref:bestrophin-like domain n=1 Tax=Thermopolyspora sp. NPDC052614 TaxID=3155682 RepID=UPI0034246B2C